MGRPTRIFMSIVCAALVLPAAASATEIAHWDLPPADSMFVEQGFGVAGPVLAGDRVAWARGSVADAWTIRSAVPGGGPQVVAQLPPVGPNGVDGRIHSLRLLGSATRLAWFEGEERVDDGRYQQVLPRAFRLTGGPPGGPFTRGVDCGDPHGPACYDGCLVSPIETGGFTMALAGDSVLYPDPCAPAGQTAPRAIDLDGGAHDGWPLAVHGPAQAPAAAGFAGVAAGSTVLVSDGQTESAVDLATGRRLGDYPRLPGGATPYRQALQPDGKLVTVTAGPGGRQAPGLVWRAPGDPVLHRLSLDVVDHVNEAGTELGPYVAIAGDRIVVRTGAAQGAQQLVLSDLAGHARTLVRFGPDGALRPAARPVGFAFDGTRLAWAAAQCERVTIGATAVDGPSIDVHRDVCARPRVVSRNARVDRRGRVEIRIACRKGCHGRLVAWRSTGLVGVVVPGKVGAARFRFGPSPDARTVRVALSAAGRAARRITLRFDGESTPREGVVTLRRAR